MNGRDNGPMECSRLWVAVLVAMSLGSGCSPSLDWREARLEGTGVIAQFPCRPDRHARPVVVASAATRMEMLVCKAGGVTFAVSFLDMPAPSNVAPALLELRKAAVSNLGGVEVVSAPTQVDGMTPNPQAVRVSMTGRLPDGAVVEEQASFFVKGLRVFQASVIGASLSPDLTAPFFAGLKLSS